MSGSGKSRWSKKLAELGFYRICCDDLIEKDLFPELKKHGFKGIEDVARWLGQPYEECFEKNQSLFLESETRVMKKVISELKKGFNRNTVVDATGSVIYTGDDIIKSLKKYSLVIYLETPKSVLEEMLEIFVRKPKPVIWGNAFSRKKGETNKKALERSYSKLLHRRSRLYKKYADTTLSYEIRRHPDFTIDDFIRFSEKEAKKKEASRQAL